jgi:CDP-diacylglycerol--serine O-phosphatidyltransferase
MHPNSICYERALLASFATWLYFNTPLKETGIVLYSIAITLDVVDGMVARRCGLVSKKGEILDPLFDKLTYLPTLLIFSFQGFLSVEFTWTLIIIEIIIGQFLSRQILQYLNRSGAANNFGKIKQCVGFVLVFYCIALDNNIGVLKIGHDILIATIALASLSIVFKFIENRFYADMLSGINLICGIVSIYLVFNQYYIESIFIHLIGLICDLFDGRMAQKHGGTKFGPLFDDLADSVNFGIYPTILIIVHGQGLMPTIIGLSYAICTFYRLIRFLTIDKKDKNYPEGIFKGLPCPAGAMNILGAWVIWGESTTLWIIVIIICYLMTSKIPFAHFGRVILKKIPKDYKSAYIVVCVWLVILIAIIIKTKSIFLFGNLLFIPTVIYMIGAIIIAKKELKKL